MQKIKRLKSTLLTKQNELWYEKEQPYTGIIFFDKEDYQLKSYWVENGKVTEKYKSVCQGELPSPIQIDCSAFENTADNSKCYEPMYDIQDYQKKPYEGIGYRFESGICIEDLLQPKWLDRKLYTLE